MLVVDVVECLYIKRVIFPLYIKGDIVWNRHRKLDEASHDFLTQGEKYLELY